MLAPQSLDDAQARYDCALHKVNSLQKVLIRAGNSDRARKRSIRLRGQVEQAQGSRGVRADRNLANTIIRAPVTGTILERAVEKGEFVTAGFVGDRGAKGYVVSLADLNDLEVELDISQADFAEPARGAAAGVVTTDAFSGPQVRRLHQGNLARSEPPESHRANQGRRSAQPDEYLRPEMNASVAFVADEKPAKSTSAASAPAAKPVGRSFRAVRDGAVFVLLDGKAVRRS